MFHNTIKISIYSNLKNKYIIVNKYLNFKKFYKTLKFSSKTHKHCNKIFFKIYSNLFFFFWIYSNLEFSQIVDSISLLRICVSGFLIIYTKFLLIH